jgi:polyisoprenoid-binding protein YceI
MNMRSLAGVLFLLCTTLAHPDPARADQAALLPAASKVELRSYGFGLVPLDGNFTRFHGWMRYDPLNPGTCQVVLEIEASSLAMSNETIRGRITGPGMMDIERFPDMAFHGTCQGDTLAGMLTMHGQTHPLTLDFVRSAGTIVATGRLKRAEWGLTGSRLLGGPTVRIRVTTPDPVSGAHT